jgi:hypothetical protein
MFVMDMPPDVPPQYAPVVIAQVVQSQKDTANADRTIGVCQLIDNPPNAPREPWTAGNGLDPLRAVRNYFRIIENQRVDLRGARLSVLENPKHGTLQETISATIEASGYEGKGYFYIPEAGYLGKDRVTFLVELADGRKVKAVHYLKVMIGVVEEDIEDKGHCPNGNYWKISFNDSDPNSPVYTFQRGSLG